ncbi:hypothetical protein D9615_009582 [Tricholomella constricta]|uniref:Reverse transcriptase domain-containing protein n=1 Tax=Tricholomella constricta TaxID=117010 RepID=A0A8H5GVV2_9AGAR|nr:hypothetical protein D9615_009582 [Tricholomella constricta]
MIWGKSKANPVASFCSEVIYTQLRLSLMDRVSDREASICVQVVVALSKLSGTEDPSPSEVEEGEPTASDVLLDILEHDSSPEVRLTALLNIPITPRSSAVCMTLTPLSASSCTAQCLKIEALLFSTSTISQLKTLELSGSRLDGPSLVHAFSRLRHLSSLIVTIYDERPSDINIVEEHKNIANILQTLGPTLSHLTVAGDLIEFETLATIKWPQLRTLRLVNHVPHGKIIPLPIVVSQMPLLRTLGYDFCAGVEHRDATIFCHDGEGNLPRLSSVLPGLTSLSISNVQSEDRIVEQLPLSLQALRVVARRDPWYPTRKSDPYRWHYSSLNEIDTFRWIDAAAKLAYLVELALTLENAPSPTVLAAIASACPQLRILELEQARFEKNYRMSPYTTESLVEALIQLHDLRDLRITMEIGVHNPPVRKQSYPPSYASIRAAKRSLLQEDGLLFAKALRSLESISFLYHNETLSLSRLDRHSVWYKMDVVRGRTGQPPFVQFLKLPAYNDANEAVEALTELRNHLRLADGWRTTYPTKKAYSFLQEATGTQSRLDRIYTSEEVMQNTREWNIEPSGIPGADHKLISVQISHQEAPWVGKGRWSIPHHVLRDKLFRARVQQEGRKALEEINTITSRTELKNPQTIYNTFKSEILLLARQRDKAIIPRIDRRLRELQNSLDKINNDQTNEEDEKRIASAEIETKMRALQQRKHQNKRQTAAARNRLEGETICKYWTTANKESKPRDMIYALRKEENNVGRDQQTYETNSQKMAELGRHYHNNLQKVETPTTPQLWEEKTNVVLENVKTKASAEQKQTLAEHIDRTEVVEALKKAKNNTAAGLDGATNELWKAIHNKYTEETALGSDTAFDLAESSLALLLTLVFNDILTNGLTPASSFSEGWMCPLYKKNDKNDIANYRPITCLNTDYKLYTKCLATRLATIAPSLIHPSQAGFIPGRRITDQTKLIRLMMHYAEKTQQNGLIMALDQEKAYDKIGHEYLWRTLKKFDLPDVFIDTVRSLYDNAETKIMINGHLSTPWKINRGVRQGDPLSCMLFDLAIEPLAASLRASTLEGYNIPNSAEKLIANLFADDTTVFLSANDDLDELQRILDDWNTSLPRKYDTH